MSEILNSVLIFSLNARIVHVFLQMIFVSFT